MSPTNAKTYANREAFFLMLFITLDPPPEMPSGFTPAPELKTALSTKFSNLLAGRCRGFRIANGIRPQHTPDNAFGEELSTGHPRTRRPKHERFVSEANVSYMLSFVRVNSRIRIGKADAITNLFHVRRLAGQESPARLGLVHLVVVLEHVYGVLFRFQRDRVHEKVLVEISSEQLLQLGQIGHDQGTDFVTLGIKEVQRNDLALDQVIIEPHLLALLGDQGDIGQMQFLYPPARLFRLCQVGRGNKGFGAGGCEYTAGKRSHS